MSPRRRPQPPAEKVQARPVDRPQAPGALSLLAPGQQEASPSPRQTGSGSPLTETRTPDATPKTSHEPAASQTPTKTRRPDAWRASHIEISYALSDRLTQLKEHLPLSHGDLIITAVETAVEAGLTAPKVQVGGNGLFRARVASTRGVKGRRVEAEESFTFRLRNADYDVIDQVKEEHGFPTRRELIITCLEALCDHHAIPTSK